ncbi:16S rRNA (guanine(966)-N(2))-methyltransferase RsmD [Bacillus sp. B15-48]|uniref:16S rRNA (guanine(966)-N(2))-methyltransferase RsmD n=1 Tax=Bacillus sp. B15-48 TaxID=1548601 RepID=UPI00193F0ED1|nr:16S rRNA (guanine(966)-N(2))-methyltransferase RsmD [Bacillus sp. B15-48]MBM4764051.1 16S rRNA (guanine(966)-N(2))-methyltransferase RsmD [Bacillus sp. B15-48]
MRVVSGKLKGYRLKAVPGHTTRPTTDKVKEALFNMIGPYFAGGVGLDLFAGSGGLGIEALSRGLEKVIFVDLDPKAIKIINENIDACNLVQHVEVYRNEAKRALKAIKKREIQFDYIFLDPPYKKQQLVNLVEIIDHDHLLKDDGIIICEHDAEIKLPKNITKFDQIRYEEYGIVGLSIYTYKEKEEEEGRT